jgi:hypothetical protein
MLSVHDATPVMDCGIVGELGSGCGIEIEGPWPYQIININNDVMVKITCLSRLGKGIISKANILQGTLRERGEAEEAWS